MMRKKQIQKTGSALILVIIVTVLLSVVGIMFVMTSRIREMTTSNFADDRDLDTAVQSLVKQIDTVLMQDLFGTNLTSGILSNGPSDSYSTDPWLASLEPVKSVNNYGIIDYYWPHVTDLYNNDFGFFPESVVNGFNYYDPTNDIVPNPNEWNGSIPDMKVSENKVWIKIIPNNERVYVIRNSAPNWSEAYRWYAGARADADGDGVADSRWVKLPNITSSRGKPVYAAVRIIDNCAMLNLNAANCFSEQNYASNTNSPYVIWWNYYNNISGAYYTYLDSPIARQYYKDGGRYLSEINYLPFLRGRELNGSWNSSANGWYSILAAKKFCTMSGSTLSSQLPTEQIHRILMSLENPRNILYAGDSYDPFDIGEELEIRNRFVMTSLTASRFERSDIGNYTFDAGGGLYAVLRIPRDNSGSYPISDWMVRMNPANFDRWRQDGTLKVSADPDYNDSYRYDRRHVCTFYSFDRNIRSGVHGRLDEAIDALSHPDLQRQAVEEIFRPLKNQPVDLRVMTDPANPDNIITPNPAIDPVSGLPEHIINAHRNILHLLYAFREKEYEALGAIGGGYDPNALAPSARKAAQQVANMIDFLDDTATATTGPFGMCCPPYGPYGLQKNCDPTYIKRAFVRQMILDVCNDYNTNHPTTPIPVIDIDQPTFSAFDFDLAATDVIYGYERQPFISEMYCNYDPSGGAQGFALELLNPYPDPGDGTTGINLNGWRITIGSTPYNLTSVFNVPWNDRLVIYAGTIVPSVPLGSQPLGGFGLGTDLSGNVLKLQRPKPDVPSRFLTVDETDTAQTTFLMSGSTPVVNVSSRDDSNWKFTNKSAYVNNNTATLGKANNIPPGAVIQKGYQLPVADTVAPLDRLADFQKITWVDPNGLTGHIATVSDEGKIRFDSQVDTELLHYVCTLSRGGKGIPGRININTAPLHVIAAAIPPQLVMTTATDPNDALAIAGQIVSNRPYADLGEMLTKVSAMKKYATINPAIVGDVSIHNDFEKRDWIFNRLSNIFTVRSDTFTAYILVRLGIDGPQRRMIAVFDRSNCWTATDQPKLVALHPVPDPR